MPTRALVVDETHLLLKSDNSQAVRELWNTIRDSRRQLQKERATTLKIAAKVVIPRNGCGWNEIELFQKYYATRGIAIVIFEKATFGSGEPAFFDGRTYLERQDIMYNDVINLYFDEEARHFDTIVNLTAAAGSRFFCSTCNVRYRYMDQHTCKTVCSACFSSPACEKDGQPIFSCNGCNRSFYGKACFDRHLQKTTKKGKKSNKSRSVCEVVKSCPNCIKRYHTYRGKHVCGVNYCDTCKEKHSTNEFCFMRPLSDEKDSKSQKILYVFYDFETTQEEPYKRHETTRIHVPNLCIAQQVCDDCMGEEDTSRMCTSCGIREHIFREDPVNQLLDLYIRRSSIFNKIILIAHNFGNFDGQLILSNIIEKRSDIIPHVILNGQKIISMRVGRTLFLDSLNFFSQKLSKLVDTFSLPAELKKSFFPHHFNVAANASYRGPMPAPCYYDPDSMSASDRKEFFDWYNAIPPDYVFDFQQEIVKYCRMDVLILRKACLAFRKIFIDLADVCPFLRACTIAACCNLYLRKKCLEPKTIGLVPAGGYHRADNHSAKSVGWLLQCERELNREIQHCGRGREYRLPEGFKVDGFLPPMTEEDGRGTVFEYEGCYTHGCPKCYTKKRDKLTSYGRPLEEVYENTMSKLKRMHELGYKVLYVWECEFDDVKRKNPEIAKFIREHPVMSNVSFNVRDSLFGGRVENFKSYYTVSEGQQISYTDICSLYPWVCKHGRFPTGHPKVIIGDECHRLTHGDYNNLTLVEGLVKVNVLAPRKLFLPLLPARINGRLMFALCRTCCETEQNEDCNHENPADREFTGIYTADELRKAVSLGYRITKIHIIWQYDKMTQFDGKSGGLFATYINTFLKIKQEASGWPSWCTTDELKEKYLRDFEEMEGIRLDSAKIEKNSGLRAVAKYMLNSMWGKLSQKNNLKQTEIIKTREAFLRLITSPEKEIMGILPVNDHVLYVNWQYKEDAVTSAPHTSVVHGSYVTSQGRLRLYEEMERLNKRLLYVDTDSCFFLRNLNNPNEYVPRIANELGAMVSELPDGAYIHTFAAPAPKFYAYRGVTPSGETFECCKAKGISLNYKNSMKINFDSIKSLVDAAFTPVVDETENTFRSIKLKFRAIRRTKMHEIVTRDEFKTCSAVLRKRRYISPSFSLPFGYKNNA